jgi:hypothetical protein
MFRDQAAGHLWKMPLLPGGPPPAPATLATITDVLIRTQHDRIS